MYKHDSETFPKHCIVTRGQPLLGALYNELMGNRHSIVSKIRFRFNTNILEPDFQISKHKVCYLFKY